LCDGTLAAHAHEMSANPSSAHPDAAGRAGGVGRLLIDRELRALTGSVVRASEGCAPIAPDQFQPASLDLRLGGSAHRIRASFSPGRASIEERLAELEIERLDLGGDGAVLQRGSLYLIPLQEELALPGELTANFNPRSSAGRCDLFARVLVPGQPRFNEARGGGRGRLWLELAPLSFPVRLARGDRLCQMRLARGDPALTEEELRAEYARTPLCFRASGPVPLEEVRFDAEGGLELHLGLAGRHPLGWSARERTPVLHFARERAHDPLEFWEPVTAEDSAGNRDGDPARPGRCILRPGRFYVFASRERVRVPPHLAAEMLPVDLGLGEMRNNYAGFFDNGFGWSGEPAAAQPAGTPAVLEVRAHDVPFLVEDGQVFFRLRFFRTSGHPERLYGQGRERDSYRDQDLTLARAFRPPAGQWSGAP
jgi:dCTP deaminase